MVQALHASINPIVRRLDPTDAAEFRALRLESLEVEPAAFATDHADESALGVADFAARLAQDVVIGAEADGQLVGIVGVHRLRGPKNRHRGLVWGLYVMPAWRRTGISRRMMEALEASIEIGIEILELEVVWGNAPAQHLYERMGYSTLGLQPKALQIDGTYYDRILMYKDLSVAPAGANRR